MLKAPALRIFGAIFAVTCAWASSSETKAQALPAIAQNSNGAASPSVGRREMISWVVLSNTYVDLKVDSLREKLDEVYPGQFLPPRDKNFVINGPTPGQFLIKSNIAGAAACSWSSASRLPTRNSPILPTSSRTRRFSATSRRNAAGFRLISFIGSRPTRTPIGLSNRFLPNSRHRTPRSWCTRKSG